MQTRPVTRPQAAGAGRTARSARSNGDDGAVSTSGRLVRFIVAAPAFGIGQDRGHHRAHRRARRPGTQCAPRQGRAGLHRHRLPRRRGRTPRAQPGPLGHASRPSSPASPTRTISWWRASWACSTAPPPASAPRRTSPAFGAAGGPRGRRRAPEPVGRGARPRLRHVRPDGDVAGVIATRVGSVTHARMLREALAATQHPLPRHRPRDERLRCPRAISASTRPASTRTSTERIARHRPLSPAVSTLPPSRRSARRRRGRPRPLPAPAAARPAHRHRRRRGVLPSPTPTSSTGGARPGASLHPFSPLAGRGAGRCRRCRGPPGRLSGASRRPPRRRQTLARRALPMAAARGALVYGECGGYMALGETLVDARRASLTRWRGCCRHHQLRPPRAHAGLPPADTRRRPPPRHLRGHEFHYATVEERARRCSKRADCGRPQRRPPRDAPGTVCGSFAHVIDQSDQTPTELRNRLWRWPV